MFIPQSHFFTDTNSISQTERQSFGSKSEDIFRVTAGFNSTGSMAYALCKGVIFIQPQEGNSQLVNLVLRPYQQPIVGLNIRYIVYRGLRIQDFFTGELVLPATAAQTDFIRKVNKTFDDFYTQTKGVKPAFAAKYIGFDPDNQHAGETLDRYFFKESEMLSTGDTTTESTSDAYELPMVQAGDSLGFFQAGECGIDIVLGYGDYELEHAVDEFVFDLAYARKNYAEINASTAATVAQMKRIKEQVTQFIDVAAFYGFHVGNGAVTVHDNGSSLKTKGVDIYNTVVSKFYTKNVLYLYIQADRGRSYNFYGNYSLAPDSNFNIKVDDTKTTFGKNQWPVQMVESTQQHQEADNLTTIQLVTDNNPEAMLYVQVGDLTNAVKNNFMDATALKGTEDPNSGLSTAYTPDLVFSNPSVGTADKKIIATFNMLVYKGVTYTYISGQDKDENGEDQDVYSKPNFIDDIFHLIKASSLIKSNQDGDYTTVASAKPELLVNYFNGSPVGLSVVQTATVKDTIEVDNSEQPLSRVLYITEAMDTLTFSTSLLGHVSSYNPTSSAGINPFGKSNGTYQLPASYYYERFLFTDVIQSVTGLLLKKKDSSIADRIILGISDAENQKLSALITSDLINPRLFFIDQYALNSQLISKEGIAYWKYKVGVLAEDLDAKLKIALPEEDIFVYSIDNLYHFSKTYSDNMPEGPKEYNFLPNQIV